MTSQSQLTEWVEEQKAIADAAAAVQQAEMAECQSRVDQLVANLLALEMERDWSVRESADEQVLEDQQKSIQNDIDRLNEELASTQTRMQGKRAISTAGLTLFRRHCSFRSLP